LWLKEASARWTFRHLPRTRIQKSLANQGAWCDVQPHALNALLSCWPNALSNLSFELGTLRHRGLPSDGAPPSFTSCRDDYWDADSPTFDKLIAEVDDLLFGTYINEPEHLLR
jgi:hypothetical protein